jgi:hypothetical protein
MTVRGKIDNRASAEDALKDAGIFLSAEPMLLNPHREDDLRNNGWLKFLGL